MEDKDKEDFKMGLRLPLSILCFIVACAHSQDTLLQDKTNLKSRYHTKNRHNHDLVSACVANISRVEMKMAHRLKESEHRLSTKFHLKLQHFNNTNNILHVKKITHDLNKKIQNVQEVQYDQSELVKDLNRKVSKQQHEIHHLKTTLKHLEKKLLNYTTLLENLMTATESPTTTIQTTPETTGTTTVPFKPLFPIDCQDVFDNGGVKQPGFYYIMIHPLYTLQPFQACCKMTNTSGWTMIQRRQDGSVSFFRTWEEYKTGFGSLDGEFWLGNEHIHKLTNQGNYRLRIEMTTWEGKEYFAEYENFRISDESDKYRLHVSGFHGDADDSLSSHNDQPFSTFDRDSDQRNYDNCAKSFQGAWWFKSCFESHLNGVYYHKGEHSNFFVRDGIQWNTIHLHSSLRSTAMMVKPNEVAEDQLTNDLL